MRRAVKAAEVQRSLVWTWGLGFLASFALLFAMTVAGTFEGRVEQAWGWFLPTILPTLGLALSSSVATGDKQSKKVVTPFVARLAKVVSILYLALVVATLLTWPLTQKGPLEWFKISGLWLGPIQGVIAGVLGAFLGTQKDAE